MQGGYFQWMHRHLVEECPTTEPKVVYWILDSIGIWLHDIHNLLNSHEYCFLYRKMNYEINNITITKTTALISSRIPISQNSTYS